MERRISAFTLIELLIVLFIIGVILTFATLSMGDFGQSQKLHTHADRFVHLLNLAKVRATLEPSVFAVQLDKTSYQFLRYDAIASHPHKNTWKSLSGRLGKRYSLPQGGWFALKNIETHDPLPFQSPALNTSRIIIFSSGEITPFVLEVGILNQKARYTITGTANGTVTMMSQK